MRKWEQIRVFDTDLNILTPQTDPQMCFQAAIANERNILLLIPEEEVDINEELEASVSRLYLNHTLKWRLILNRVVRHCGPCTIKDAEKGWCWSTDLRVRAEPALTQNKQTAHCIYRVEQQTS
jgi:hypothetical protein